MKRLISAAAVFVLAVTCIALTALIHEKNAPDRTGGYAVALNEIENLSKDDDTEAAASAAAALRQEMRSQEQQTRDLTVPLMWAVCVLFIAGVSVYGYAALIRPFERLTRFAEQIALGDLELPLEYPRNRTFGKFVWAFDSMRNEIRKARVCEQEAIENNKTVIASLSHDIKTPVSSIRAYAEALELGMDRDAGTRSRYIGVIMQKCDEVSKLTEDMLTHSLHDLNRLKMSPEVFELRELAEETLCGVSADMEGITLEKPAFELRVYADRSRTAQLIENLVNNARKYAATDITVKLARRESSAVLTVRDYGGGIPDEDIPFIWNKFYRGKNSGGQKGAGLGLFIVRYIAEQSGGTASLANCDKGLEVTVTLPLAEPES